MSAISVLKCPSLKVFSSKNLTKCPSFPTLSTSSLPTSTPSRSASTRYSRTTPRRHRCRSDLKARRTVRKTGFYIQALILILSVWCHGYQFIITPTSIRVCLFGGSPQQYLKDDVTTVNMPVGSSVWMDLSASKLVEFSPDNEYAYGHYCCACIINASPIISISIVGRCGRRRL